MSDEAWFADDVLALGERISAVPRRPAMALQPTGRARRPAGATPPPIPVGARPPGETSS